MAARELGGGEHQQQFSALDRLERVAGQLSRDDVHGIVDQPRCQKRHALVQREVRRLDPKCGIPDAACVVQSERRRQVAGAVSDESSVLQCLHGFELLALAEKEGLGLSRGRSGRLNLSEAKVDDAQVVSVRASHTRSPASRTSASALRTSTRASRWRPMTCKTCPGASAPWPARWVHRAAYRAVELNESRTGQPAITSAAPRVARTSATRSGSPVRDASRSAVLSSGKASPTCPRSRSISPRACERPKEPTDRSLIQSARRPPPRHGAAGPRRAGVGPRHAEAAGCWASEALFPWPGTPR